MREETRDDGKCEGPEKEVKQPLPKEVIDLAVAEVNRLKDKVHQGEAFMADDRVSEADKAKHRRKYLELVFIYSSACRILQDNPEGVAIRTGEGEVIPLEEIDERLKPFMDTIRNACDIFDGEVVPPKSAPEMPDSVLPHETE